MMKDVDPLLAAGKEVGGYRVEYPLGQGGMGAVYAAVEPTIGRRVAIKVLRAELGTDPKHALRFEREARSVSLVRHPAVIDVFSFGKLDDGRPYFVMSLLTGRTLRDELARVGKIEPDEAWRIGREVASGLGAAHAVGVLHRDLKPDNIFLSEYAGRRSQPILLDFGLAKRTDAGSEEVDPKDDVKLTATGVPMGTPVYMAPEQWWSRPSSHATDQYAFGVVLFELLTGRPPFDSQRFPELLQQHLHQKPPSLASVGVAAGDAVEAFIARLLEKEPDDRFKDVEEMIAEGDRAFAAAQPAAVVATAQLAAHSNARTDVATHDTVAAMAGTERALPSPATGVTGPVRSTRLAYALVLALGLGVLWGVGYGGSIRWNLVEWYRSMGRVAHIIVVVAVIATAALPRLASLARIRPAFGPIALMAALAPVAVSLFGAYLGWLKTTEVIGRFAPAQGFGVLHAGYFELGTVSFVGLGVGASLCLGLVVLLGAPPIERSPWALAASTLLAAGAAVSFAGYASAALVLIPTSAAVALLSTWTTTPTTLSRERALAAISAVLCARGASQTRADACAASVWFKDSTRAERVDALVRAATDQQLATLAQIGSVVLIVVLGALVLRRARQAGMLDGEAQRTRWFYGGVQAGLVVLLLVPALTIERDFDARRDDLGATLREQFVFFSKLDPPNLTDRVLLPPVAAPAIQITEDTIALNGRGIGRLTALDTEIGRQALASALVVGLAAPTRPASEEQVAPARSVDLALLVDRRVPWGRVEQVLRLAYDGGARSADLLLTRGVEPKVPSGAPPEAGHLLPGDFVALSLSLGEQGLRPPGGASFAEVTTDLLAAPGAGESPIAVAVGGAR